VHSSKFDSRERFLIDGLVQDRLDSPGFGQGLSENLFELIVHAAFVVGEDDQLIDEVVNLLLHIQEDVQGVEIGQEIVGIILDPGEEHVRVPDVLPSVVEHRVEILVQGLQFIPLRVFTPLGEQTVRRAQMPQDVLVSLVYRKVPSSVGIRPIGQR
jgi:hypothetical protein